jgi:hypothetical protein
MRQLRQLLDTSHLERRRDEVRRRRQRAQQAYDREIAECSRLERRLERESREVEEKAAPLRALIGSYEQLFAPTSDDPMEQGELKEEAEQADPNPASPGETASATPERAASAADERDGKDAEGEKDEDNLLKPDPQS